MLKLGLFSYAFPYPNGGFNPGIESVVYNLAKCLSSKAKVTIYTSSINKDSKREYLDGMQILRANRLKLPLFSMNMFTHALNILKDYRNEIIKEDILHDMGSSVSCWFGTLNKPSLATFYHYESPEGFKGRLTALPLSILARKYLSADRIIVPSEFSKQQLLSRFNIPDFKIHIIPLGVEHNVYNPFVIPDHRLKNAIIFVGVLSVRKGPIYLVRAVPLIKKEMGDVKVFIIGEGPQKDFLFKEAARLGVKNNIEFLGFLSKKDLPTYFRSAAVTVLPSLLEGFGLVALESMASATPVVASDIEPLISLIGKGGLFFPAGDHIALARQVIRILKDENLRNVLSKEAQRTAKEYLWEKTAQQHLELYQQLLSQISQTHPAPK